MVYAYDIYFPFKKIVKKAISNFESQYLYATDNYFAKQYDNDN